MEDTLVPTVSVGTRLPTLCVVVLAGAGNDRLVGRDAERRDGRSHAERGNEEFMGTFQNGEPVGSSVAGNACEGNRAESRRHRRKMRRKRKKEWRQRLATGDGAASHQAGAALATPS